MSSKSLICSFCLLVITAGNLLAEAPLKLSDIASPETLVAEAKEKGEEIAKSVATEATYNEELKSLRPSASLVALIGQALAEQSSDAEWQKVGPSLRDAAIAVARAKTYGDAVAGNTRLQAALKGEVDAGATAEFDWAKLTKMHPIMEEMSGRGAKFRRVLRRPKDPEVDSRHVAAIALAAVSTYADTHEVKDPADLPMWRELATELHSNMTQAALAVRSKETDKAREFFDAGMQTCTKCHEKFQD